MEIKKPNILTTHASGEWAAPKMIKGTAGKFDIVMDQSQPLGGTDLGPSPMDMVTAALVGCTGITLPVIAKQMDFSFESAHFEAEGEIDVRGFYGQPGICKHFCSFRGTFVIETQESEERLREIAAMLEDRCPVFNLLHDAGVKTEIEWKKK